MTGLLAILAKETFRDKLILAVAASLGAEAAKAAVAGVSRLVSDHYNKRQQEKDADPAESEAAEGDK